ncbi:signal peptide peptidase-like 2B [Protopterus annectens]|uniref:signal peptide peptidase-like 2B n=1 Tax=Protopterus annectens TaxID=7888 RepID=UPI001CFA0DEC|nr:signal peptide peptidase-like 2B [Protopterus annectens]
MDVLVGLLFGILIQQVLCQYGMVHVVSEKGHSNPKDYCILFNSQWAHLPYDLSKAALLPLEDQTPSVLCSASDVPRGGFINKIPMIMRGNCTFYEKVRLAQLNGAKGLIIVSRERLVSNKLKEHENELIERKTTKLKRDLRDYETGKSFLWYKNSDNFNVRAFEVAVTWDYFIALLLLVNSPVLVSLSFSGHGQVFGKSVKVALYAPNEPVLDYNMVIIFLMAVGTVAFGGYWAGSRDVKRRYMKHKRDDSAEKHEDETLDVTPIMICMFVLMCCSMLVLLYYLYDHLVYVIIAIFCLAASIGLYSCLYPFVRRLPFGSCRIPDNNLPYFHKRPQVRMLVLAAFCISVSVIWGVFRNEDQWAWVLQDTLGIAFCLYMLKTIRLPTFKVLPMVLKVPRLNASPLALCDRPFSLLGFGDVLVPGLLVVYCHRFDIQVQSSRIYFVACTVAYGIGLLVTFVALAVMQVGQPALLYLVPCTLLTSLGVALWRRELSMFWNGSGFVKEVPCPSLVMAPVDCNQGPEESLPSSQQEGDAELINPTVHSAEHSNPNVDTLKEDSPKDDQGQSD